MSQNNSLENFKFPDFILKTNKNQKDSDYAHICFIRKHRVDKNTRYVFKSPGIDIEKVSNKLLGWLKDNYEKIDLENICKYNAGVPQETKEWVRLNDISTWNHFLNPINHNFDREIDQKELDKMDTNFAGVMIFCTKNKCVYGQITKLTPKFVLNNSENFLAIFDSDGNNYISELKNEKGFRISSYPDLLFSINSEGVASAIIFSKQKFEEIFDIGEELKLNAIEVLSKIELFVENPAYREIENFVKQDRTIQRMLNNRVFLDGSIRYLTFAELKRLKEAASEILLFEISEDGKSFVLPNDNSKGRALRQIIKAISRRYIVSGNNEVLMENAGITESWNLDQFKKDMIEVAEDIADEQKAPIKV